MNPIWLIVRKDLRRFRSLLVTWVAVMGAIHLLAAIAAGSFGTPHPAWLNQLHVGAPLFFFITCFSPVVAIFLTASLVFADPPSGKEAFWVTRPISRPQLLASKLLGALFIVLLPPLLIAVPWWLLCGYRLAEMARLALDAEAAYLAIVLLAMAVASATDGFPRFIVWSIAGLAVIFAGYLYGLTLFGNGIPPGTLPFHLAMIVTSIAVISAAVIAQRYLVRGVRVIPVIATVLLWIGGIAFVSRPPAALLRWAVGTPAAVRGADNVRVAIAGNARGLFSGGLTLPLRIEGLSPDLVPLVQAQTTWAADDGRVWTLKGRSADYRGALRQAARFLLELPADPHLGATQSVPFLMSAANVGRIAEAATTIKGSATLDVSEARLLAEVPLRNQVKRYDGGSLTISDLTAPGGELSLTVTTRTRPNVAHWYGSGYGVLVNRTTGELIEPSQMNNVVGGVFPALNQVLVRSTWLHFKIPSTEWREQATFALIGLGERRAWSGELPTYTRPQRLLLPGPVPAVVVAPEVLQRYRGTYRPRPGATLTVEVQRGKLVLQDRGFFRVTLYPESDTRFGNPYENWLFAEAPGFTVEFIPDAQGTVTHFIATQNGRTYVVPRVPDAAGK